jgi:hypothetical protein
MATGFEQRAGVSLRVGCLQMRVRWRRDCRYPCGSFVLWVMVFGFGCVEFGVVGVGGCEGG